MNYLDKSLLNRRSGHFKVSVFDRIIANNTIRLCVSVRLGSFSSLHCYLYLLSLIHDKNVSYEKILIDEVCHHDESVHTRCHRCKATRTTCLISFSDNISYGMQ
jgi:hypothetical protein